MLLLLHITLAVTTLLSATFVLVRSRVALLSIREAKRLTECELGISDCLSTLTRLIDMQKKLSQRQALSDFRSEKKAGTTIRSADDIPFGDKAALRARFGAQAASMALNHGKNP